MAAIPTDSRASGFNAAAFKDAVKFAMRMGAPNSVEERATFIWTPQKTFAAADSNNKAWTKDATPSSTATHADVQVDCAVEFQARSTFSSGVAMGEFDTPRAVITLLAEEYAQLFDTDNDNKMADKVKLGRDTYVIDFVAPPIGLFTVTVYQIHVSALDEV